MASENEKLHDTLYQSEKDTINVVKFLKKDDMAKDEKVYYCFLFLFLVGSPYA